VRVETACETGISILNASLNDSLKEVSNDLASKVMVGELKCEEKVGAVSRVVDELKDRVCAFELKMDELKKEFPTPSEWTTVGRNKKRNDKKALDIFAETFKDCPKDTVLVMGASLVKGIGRKLETNTHIVTAIGKGGAKIEDITNDVGMLEGKEHRHLVVMVGTNNIQKEGSETVLKKFKDLIEKCKQVRNRKVTVIAIPKRLDLTGFQESRRLGVNERLEKMCREKGVEFLECEVARSRMSWDRVHLNELGQDEVVRKIFKHCVHHFLG
jgi:hypothetical protein